MNVTAVAARSFSTAVFEQLRDQIINGELKPGEALPAERMLCAHFGVNRHAIREALKRLQQLGLVAVKQGESTRVLDPIQHGGLELLTAMVLDPSGRIRVDVVRALFEMRTAIGPDIARLAATRRTQYHLDDLCRRLDRMEQLGDGNLVALQREHMLWWQTLVEGSANVAYQLMFNTMAQAWEGFGELAAPVMADELTDNVGYRMLLRAITRRQPAAAERAARRLVEKGSNAIITKLPATGVMP